MAQRAWIELDCPGSPSKAFTNKRGKLSGHSMKELELLLIQALAKEDYERAAKIRNAIEEKGG